MNAIRQIVAAIGLGIGLAGGAQALNIVSNGGFESGSLSSWTETGNAGFAGVDCFGGAASGSCFGFFGPVGAIGGISQVLTTIPGDYYTIEFAFGADGGAPSSFSALFAGNTLTNILNPAASAFHTLTFVSRATGSSSLLQFNFRDDPAFMYLDSVSVTVPEPATLALFGVALSGMWFVRRRKKTVTP